MESHKQAVSKSRLSVSIVPTVPLASMLAPCSNVHPVPLCFTGPPMFLHISTSLFSPSFAWCELWQTLQTLLHSTRFHFLPLARWPGCPAGATCSPPGQLACLMVPFIRTLVRGLGGPHRKRLGWDRLVIDFTGIVIKQGMMTGRRGMLSTSSAGDVLHKPKDWMDNGKREQKQTKFFVINTERKRQKG